MNERTQVQVAERQQAVIGRGAEACMQAFRREQEAAQAGLRRDSVQVNTSIYDINMSAIKEFLASL